MTNRIESDSEPASSEPLSSTTPGGTQHEAGVVAATAKGGAVALVGQAASLVTTLAAAAVLARILGPEEYGLVGMVTVFTGLLLVVNDIGMVLATIQKREIDQETINGAFYLQLAASAAVTAIALALAPLLGWFYDEPRIIGIAVGLSPSFLLIGLFSQHHALMRRAMRFGTVTSIGVAAMVGASLVAIAVALLGGGYWALVAQVLTQHCIIAVCSWVLCPWRPGHPSISGVRHHVRFGTPFLTYKLFDYLVQSTDKLLLGWVHGAGPLGLYTRSFSLLTQPMAQLSTPLTQVVVPGLSRLQSDPAAFRAMFTKALNLIAWAMLPFGTVVLIGADQIVYLLLGPDWKEAGRILNYAGVVILALPMSTAFSWLLLPLGRTTVMLRWGIVSAVVVTAAASASLPFGARGMAAARGASSLILGLGGLVYATRGTPVRTGHIWIALRWPLVSTALSLMLAPLLVAHWPIHHPIPQLLALSALVAAVTTTVLAASGELRAAISAGRLVLSRQG